MNFDESMNQSAKHIVTVEEALASQPQLSPPAAMGGSSCAI